MTKLNASSSGIETTVQAVPAGMDPKELLEQQMDDCPLCLEARARGEVPEIHVAGGDELIGRIRRPTKPFPQRPRWRMLKRRAQ
jgi:hypothetical protein